MFTMTGIDAKTSATWIKDMGSRFVTRSGYTAVEFAILRSPKVGQSARYPTRAEIDKITNYVYPNQLAFHLCGRYAEMVHSLEWRELCDIIDFSLVSRVQVNSTQCDAAAILTLQRFAVHIEKPVVMQWREVLFPCAPGLQFLQDRSSGRGVAETQWFQPDDLCRKRNSKTMIGYAGGLNPDNINDALPKMRAAARGMAFWVDCETGVRTDDWFDTEKAEAMAQAVIGERPKR